MSVNGYVSGYYATVKLTSLLSGGDDTELISEIIKTFRRIKDVPENLIIAILEYRGYTGEPRYFYPTGPRIVRDKKGTTNLIY